MSNETVSPLSDSPWFWLYLFATAGLIGGALIQPKFNQRQSQIERQYQGRARAEQAKQGEEATVEMSTPEHNHWNMKPLLQLLAGGAVLGWVVFWWRRRTASAVVETTASTDLDSAELKNS